VKAALLGPVLLDLCLIKVPQLVNAGCLASRDTLCKLDKATDLCSLGNGVLCGADLDADDANAGVLWATVVLAIPEVANPGLERW
jgi:hypothetical protein